VGASPSLAPHWAQNFEPAAFSLPHAAHLGDCGAPHCGQKRLASAMLALQPGQIFVIAIGLT
jgi:hypothetical protein